MFYFSAFGDPCSADADCTEGNQACGTDDPKVCVCDATSTREGDACKGK